MFAIEALSIGVPIENRPIHSRPSTLGGDFPQAPHQGTADPAPAILLTDEKVFEVEATMAGPSRIISIEQRKAGRLAFIFRQDAFERRIAALHLGAEFDGRHFHSARRAFIFCKSPDKPQNRGG